MQEVIIVGRMGKEPEMQYFESGKVKTRFSLATSGYDSNKKEKITNWFNIECWGKTAEFVGEYGKKGTMLVAQGTLKKETYEKDGVTKTINKITANKVGFDGAFGLISQVVEKTQDLSDKEQIIKMYESDVKITNKLDIQVAEGGDYTLLLELGVNDKQITGRTLKID